MSKQGDFKVELALFLLLFFVFNVNLKDYSCGDTLPVKHLPVSLLDDLDFELSEYYHLKGVYGHGFMKRGRRVYSAFPVGMALLSIPFYIPFFLLGLTSQSVFIHMAGKIAVSFFSALSAVYVYRLLEAGLSKPDSVMISVAYGVGTTLWSISSQDMYQHAGTQLFLAGFIYYLVKSRVNQGNIKWAGFSLGLAYFIRYSVIIFTPIFIVYVWIQHRKKLPVFLASMAFPIILITVINLSIYGHVLGPYERNLGEGIWRFKPASFLGLLFSPSRGLLVYSPFLVFSLSGVKKALDEKNLLYTSFIIAILVHTLFFSFFHNWYGGHTWGPRMMSETLPFLMALLGLGYPQIKSRRTFFYLFILFVSLSVFIHFLGAFSYDGGWNTSRKLPEKVWSIKDSQILYYLKNPKIHIYYWEIS